MNESIHFLKRGKMNNQNSSAIKSKQNVSCGSKKRFIMRQEVIRSTGKSFSEAHLLHQLTHNMTKDCSSKYKDST